MCQSIFFFFVVGDKKVKKVGRIRAIAYGKRNFNKSGSYCATVLLCSRSISQHRPGLEWFCAANNSKIKLRGTTLGQDTAIDFKISFQTYQIGV